jgi:hypothetical protein
MNQLMKIETKDRANVVFEQNPEHSQWQYSGVTYSLKKRPANFGRARRVFNELISPVYEACRACNDK